MASKDTKSVRQPKSRKDETASVIIAAILERLAKFLPEEEQVFILLPLSRNADAEIHEIADAAGALEQPGRYARGCFVSGRYDPAAFLHFSRLAFLAGTSDPEAIDDLHAAAHDEDDHPAVQTTDSGSEFH